MIKKREMEHTENLNMQEPTPLDERVVLESISDGMIVSDVEGRVALFNRAAVGMLGIDVHTAPGQPVRALLEPFPARGPVSVIGMLDRLYADPYTDEQGQEITEAVISVGTQVIRTRLSPVLTEVGEFLGVVTMLRDVTREVEAERARSELVFDVSHELRAPLTAIRGYSEMLLRRTSGRLDEQQEHFLRIIQRNSDRLVALVNDLLDISRVVSSQLELDLHPVQLDLIVRDVADMIQPQCDQKGVHLAVDIEPDIGSVLGDMDRLTQVVANLASNACRHTPEGGHITFTVSCSDDAVQVKVADTSAGLAPEDQAKIFQRYYRMDMPTLFEVRGTGLELPIAKMLVEMHGGRMWMESEVGKGSVFTFVLPLHAEAVQEEPIKEAKRSKVGRTILVVEDDADTLQLIALQLRQEGFDVLTASRGEEALELARTPGIALITLDIMLPDITGMDVLRRLKADRETADIPVIVVSVLQPGASVEGTGAADHVTKPFALERLMASIRRTLATVW
jgi:PAS domain S-box-containing protein